MSLHGISSVNQFLLYRKVVRGWFQDMSLHGLPSLTPFLSYRNVKNGGGVNMCPEPLAAQ